MILLRILLFPFSWLYYLVTQIRNRLYDQGLRPSVRFEFPVICVGNLTVGGTGKTPMVEHLIRLMRDRHKIATLSRGYGRATKGFRIAGDSDNADTLGDEPYQFYKKFGKEITVAVGEERALSIPLILQEHQEISVVLLDDAFQHRKVAPSFSILLTDYNRPFYNDFLLPSGRLRESRWSAGRADIVVVTKCPAETSEDEMMKIEKLIRSYAEKPVFFTSIRYGRPTPFLNSPPMPTQRVVLISGIANARPLETYVKQNYTLVRHFAFSDHHKYSIQDIESFLIIADKDPGVSFLTTEKDKVKLDVPLFHELIAGKPFYYIPIEMDFIKNGKDFDEMVLNVVKSVQK
jgi:tetraacyldisaccharide 4'-kinase